MGSLDNFFLILRITKFRAESNYAVGFACMPFPSVGDVGKLENPRGFPLKESFLEEGGGK